MKKPSKPAGRVLIVGAGPAGLGAAHRLHELGHTDWCLYEKRDSAGGLSASVVDEAGFTWDLGGHVLFSHYEYFDALDPAPIDGTGTFATMYRDRRFKLCLYHGHDLGELFDLEVDPWEFDDLWDDPAYRDVKHELIRSSFDAHVLLTTDVGSRRIAPM